MVDRFLGPTTAVVFRALLRALENRTKLIRSATKSDDADDNDDEDDEMESATDAEIYEHLDPVVDIDSKYLPAKNPKPSNGVRNHRKKNRGTVNEAEDGAQLDIKVETHSDSEHEHEIQIYQFSSYFSLWCPCTADTRKVQFREFKKSDSELEMRPMLTQL